VWAGVVVVLVLVAAALVGTAGASSAPTARPTVTPTTAQPGGAFHLSFTAPRPTGAANGLQSSIVITADGPQSTTGCLATVDRTATAKRRGEVIHMTLSPGSRSWCTGSFHGRVSETGRPICKATVPCPQFIELTPIGAFSFIVRRSH
jgi:hypothetical protein